MATNYKPYVGNQIPALHVDIFVIWLEFI